jgi:hypothetical protein
MKHLFATLVGLTIIILAAFSVKFLIYGFPKAIENSSFNPAPLSAPLTTKVDCEDFLKVTNDLKISGNSVTSQSLGFTFSPTSNWTIGKQLDDPSMLSSTFTDDSQHRFMIVIASKMYDECFDKEKKDLDDAYASGEVRKDLASWHKENKTMQLVDAGELQPISDMTYTKDGVKYCWVLLCRKS